MLDPGGRELERRILRRIARGEETGPILDDLCRLVQAEIPPSLCSVMVFDPTLGGLRILAAPDASQRTVEVFKGLVPGERAGSCGTAYFTREAVIVEDTRTDPRWEDLRSVACELGIRACWSIPLLWGEETLGTFAISRSERGGPTAAERTTFEVAASLAELLLGRERDQRRLTEQRKLLETLLESASDGIFAKDCEGRYLLANRAEAHLLGLEPEEMLGRTDYELYGIDLAGELRAQDLQVLHGGRKADFRIDLPGREGLPPRTVLVCKSPLRGAGGEVRGVVGIVRDVTALERAEAFLADRQSTESLDVLAGGVAHDFNNLLTGILGNAALARDELREGDSPDAVHRSLDAVERAATRAAELTEQLLAYAGRPKARAVPLRLDRLVEEVLELSASSHGRHTRIEYSCRVEAPVVQGEPTQLRQLVLNLLTNAWEALAERPGRVWVSIDRSGESYQLTVADEGEGMSAEVRGRIFEPFFTTKTTGRGLGLAAAQGIAQGHGGSLECQSTPGRGTTFTLTLPRHVSLPRRPPLPSRAAAESPAGERSSLPGHVLIADDLREPRSFMRRVFVRAGYRVTEARSGGQALDLARELAGELDLLLFDVRMPDMWGDEVLLALWEEGINLPAVLTSGFGQGEIDAAVRERVPFLKKPFRPEELLALAEMILEERVPNASSGGARSSSE